MKTAGKVILTLIAILVIVLIGIFFYSGFSGNAVKEDKPVVKIGVSLPLTGMNGFIGQGMKNAMELAKEKIKNNTKYDYQIIYEDDKLDDNEAMNVANKLIEVDKVDAIISVTSGPGNVIAPIAEKTHVLHMGTASDGNIAKKEYNFLDWTSPESEAKTFVEELQRRNIKRIAIIGANQQGMIAITDSIKEDIKSTEIKVTYEEFFNSGEKDFKTILAKAKESEPDIYFIMAFSPDLELFMKQAKEMDITNITCIEAFEYSEQPHLFDGLWYVNAAESTSEFSNMYELKYGKKPTVATPNAYDEINLLVTAYENAGKNLGPNEKPTTEQVANELLKIKNYHGALGTLSVLDNRIIDSKAVVREMIDGKPVTIGGSN